MTMVDNGIMVFDDTATPAETLSVVAGGIIGTDAPMETTATEWPSSSVQMRLTLAHVSGSGTITTNPQF